MAMAKTTTKPAPKAKSTKPLTNAELESRFTGKYAALVDYIANPAPGVSTGMIDAVRGHFAAYKAFCKQIDREDGQPDADNNAVWARKSHAEERALDALVGRPATSAADAAFKAGYLLKWSPGQGLWARPETGDAFLRSMAVTDPDAPILALARKWVSVYDDAYGIAEDLNDTPQMKELHVISQRMRTAKPVTPAGVAAKGLIDASFGDFALEDATIDDMIRVSGIQPPQTMVHYYKSRKLPVPMPPARPDSFVYVRGTDDLDGPHIVSAVVDEVFAVRGHHGWTPLSRIFAVLSDYSANDGDPVDAGIVELWRRVKPEMSRSRSLGSNSPKAGTPEYEEFDRIGALIYLMHTAILETPANTMRGRAIQAHVATIQYLGNDDYIVDGEADEGARTLARITGGMLRASEFGPQIMASEAAGTTDWDREIQNLKEMARGIDHLYSSLFDKLEFCFDRSRGRRYGENKDLIEFTFNDRGLERTEWLMDEVSSRILSLREEADRIADGFTNVMQEAEKANERALARRIMLVPVTEPLHPAPKGIAASDIIRRLNEKGALAEATVVPVIGEAKA